MIRKQNKPRIYWCRYQGGWMDRWGYWRVEGIGTRWKHLNEEEQRARVLAHSFCSKLNGKIER